MGLYSELEIEATFTRINVIMHANVRLLTMLPI